MQVETRPITSPTRLCPQCKQVKALKIYQHSVGVPHKDSGVTAKQDFEDRCDRWWKGALIQDVWPDATPEEREQLMTGICSDHCWRLFNDIIEGSL